MREVLPDRPEAIIKRNRLAQGWHCAVLALQDTDGHQEILEMVPCGYTFFEGDSSNSFAGSFTLSTVKVSFSSLPPGKICVFSIIMVLKKKNDSTKSNALSFGNEGAMAKRFLLDIHREYDGVSDDASFFVGELGRVLAGDVSSSRSALKEFAIGFGVLLRKRGGMVLLECCGDGVMLTSVSVLAVWSTSSWSGARIVLEARGSADGWLRMICGFFWRGVGVWCVCCAPNRLMVPASAECVLWRCGGHARNWYDVVVGDLVDLGCQTGSGLGGKSKRTWERSVWLLLLGDGGGSVVCNGGGARGCVV